MKLSTAFQGHANRTNRRSSRWPERDEEGPIRWPGRILGVQIGDDGKHTLQRRV